MTGILADYWNAVGEVREAHATLREISPGDSLLSLVDIKDNNGGDVFLTGEFYSRFKLKPEERSYDLINALQRYAGEMNRVSTEIEK